jgi:hypothetical protein
MTLGLLLTSVTPQRDGERADGVARRCGRVGGGGVTSTAGQNCVTSKVKNRTLSGLFNRHSIFNQMQKELPTTST